MKQLFCRREFRLRGGRVVECRASLGHDGPCTEVVEARCGWCLTSALEGRRTFKCEHEEETLYAFAWALKGDTVTLPAGALLMGDTIKPGVTVRTEGER